MLRDRNLHLILFFALSLLCHLKLSTSFLFQEEGSTELSEKCRREFPRDLTRSCSIEAKEEWKIAGMMNGKMSKCCAFWDEIDCSTIVIKDKCGYEDYFTVKKIVRNTREELSRKMGCDAYPYKSSKCLRMSGRENYYPELYRG
jgi:hypothetical protein